MRQWPRRVWLASDAIKGDFLDGNRFSLYGNELKASYARKAAKWQDMFTNRFDYDPDEQYNLSLKPNPYLGDEFGSMAAVRDADGDPIDVDGAVAMGVAEGRPW